MSKYVFNKLESLSNYDYEVILTEAKDNDTIYKVIYKEHFDKVEIMAIYEDLNNEIDSLLSKSHNLVPLPIKSFGNLEEAIWEDIINRTTNSFSVLEYLNSARF